MIRVGKSAYNPKFIRSIHITQEPYDVTIKIVAVNDRGQKITLKSINRMEDDNAEQHINDWFAYYIDAMEGGDTK